MKAVCLYMERVYIKLFAEFIFTKYSIIRKRVFHTIVKNRLIQ